MGNFHVRWNDWRSLTKIRPRTIGIHWRPVAQKVAILLDWASAPRSIFEGESLPDSRIALPVRYGQWSYVLPAIDWMI